MAKLVQPTSDWAPDYVKAQEDGGGEERCPAFPRDIIRNQTDLTYVDVDCASTRGHQDFPASTRGEKLQGSGVELSTDLRKVSQCPEKAYRSFSLLKVPTYAFTILHFQQVPLLQSPPARRSAAAAAWSR